MKWFAGTSQSKRPSLNLLSPIMPSHNNPKKDSFCKCVLSTRVCWALGPHDLVVETGSEVSLYLCLVQIFGYSWENYLSSLLVSSSLKCE